MDSYQFCWSRPPQMREYVWPTVATVLAFGLSSTWIWTIIDPEQRSADPMDGHAMWIIALTSWFLPFFSWLMLINKRQQYRDRIPVLIIDDRGISVKNWRRKSLTFSWSETSFERVQRGRDDDMFFQAGKISGLISLNDLDRNPTEIIDVMNRCSGHMS
jgi:hypothetical protein